MLPKTPETQSQGEETNDVSNKLDEGMIEEDTITRDTNESIIIENDPCRLNLFSRLTFAAILEEVILAVCILGESNNHIRLEEARQNLPLLTKTKYGIDIADETANPESQAQTCPKAFSCEEHKLTKFRKDRESFLEIIKLTLKALVADSTFRPLWNYCQEITENEQRVVVLNNDYTQNQLNARALHRHLRQQRVQHKSFCNDYDYNINRLHAKIEDTDMRLCVEQRFIQRWQNACTCQHDQALVLEEDRHSNNIELYRKRSQLEGTVHSYVGTFLTTVIEDLLTAIDDMMDKYDTDLEAIAVKIQIARINYFKARDERLRLQKMLPSRAVEIQEWVEFKERRAREQEHRGMMHQAALVVQAWWRGILVRKKLGPFRPRNERRRRSMAKRKQNKQGIRK